MQYVPVHVDDLTACPCGEHAIVSLANDQGRPRARVRIAAEFARALPAYDAGLVSGPAAVVIALTDCMRMTGVNPAALILWREGEDLRVCLRVRSAGAETDVAIEPGVGFLTARHLDLEILLARRTAHDEQPAAAVEERSAIPDVYRPVLDGLDWDSE
jgi:hypothetical protein